MLKITPAFIPLQQRLHALFMVCAILFSIPAQAENIYQTPDEFIHTRFAGSPPAPEILWLENELKKKIETILDHKYDGQRIRYWQQGSRSLWILEEIGKTKPITVGIVVNRNKIETIRVLVFRESRGWEVKYPFFTQQFEQAGLTGEHQLDKHIDGISGATLSVRAVTKLARIALLLDQTLQHD